MLIVEAPDGPEPVDAAVVQPWRLVTARPTALALGAALAIASLPYWEVLSGHRSAMYGDVNDVMVPQYLTVWRSIAAGHWPWWTPNVFAGHSMLGAGQYAIFYPANVLFGLLAPVTAYRWWLLLHIWIATAGAFAWSWRRFGSRAGAIVSGVAYSGSGFAVLHLVHMPFVIAVAWLPVLFCGVDLVHEQWTTLRALLVATAIAMIAFAGQPQMLWIALVGVIVYALVLATSKRAGLRSVARVAAGAALGVGISAVQLLPLWQFSRSSQRPSLSMAAAFDLSLWPHHLLTLVFPWLYGGSSQGSAFSSPWLGGDTQHEVGMFAGATIVALAVTALIWRHRDVVVRGLAAVAVVSVLIALGRSTPLGHLFYDVLPLAKSFRVWARTMLLLNLAAAMLAGAGVREVIRSPQRAVLGLGTATVSLAIVAFCLPHVSSFRNFLVGGPYGVVARGLPVAFLLGLVAAVAITVVHPRVGACALVAICSLEVVSFAYAAEWRGQSAPIHDLHAFYDSSTPPSFGLPYAAPGGVDRWITDTYSLRSVSLAKNMRGVNGYDPLIQKDWASTAAGFAYDGNPTRPDFWHPGWLADVLRVSTLILDDKIAPTDPTWRRVGSVPGLAMARWEREPRLPEAYLVGRVMVAPLAAIRAALVNPSSPMLTTAFVEQNDSRIHRLDDASAAGRVEAADVLGSGRIVVEAQRDSLLVLSHDWEAGWHATVDGQPVKVLRTNGLVLGVPVPAGHHVVRVGFRPPGLVAGALITLLSLVMLLGSAPVVRRVRSVLAHRRVSEGQPLQPTRQHRSRR
jgi:hypothetical protein